MAPCSLVEVDRRFGGEYCFRYQDLMMEAVRISETSVYFHETCLFHIAEGCHLKTHRRENLKSHLD
jgi:hypothetical protein